MERLIMEQKICDKCYDKEYKAQTGGCLCLLAHIMTGKCLTSEIPDNRVREAAKRLGVWEEC